MEKTKRLKTKREINITEVTAPTAHFTCSTRLLLIQRDRDARPCADPVDPDPTAV